MKNNYKILCVIFFIFFGYLFYIKQNKKESIIVFSWYNSFNSELIREFESKTGITAHVKYYASNEELVSKLAISKEPIDVVFPTDYAFDELIKLQLLRPLDLSRIESAKIIAKDLFIPVHIKKKYYGIPREWGIFGLVINKKTKDLIPNNLLIYKSFFEGHFKNKPLRIASDNDVSVITNFIYFYYKNFFKNNKIDSKENLFTIMYEILKKQKKSILLYSDNLLENLFVDNLIDIAILQSDRYLKMIKNDTTDLYFVLSPYHNLKVIEYAAIPTSSKQVENAYKFINFIMEKKILKKDAEECCFFPSRIDLINELDEKSKKIIREISEIKQTVKPTRLIFDKKESANLWMKVKS